MEGLYTPSPSESFLGAYPLPPPHVLCQLPHAGRLAGVWGWRAYSPEFCISHGVRDCVRAWLCAPVCRGRVLGRLVIERKPVHGLSGQGGKVGAQVPPGIWELGVTESILPHFQTLGVYPVGEKRDLQLVGATSGARFVAHWASSQGVGSVNPLGTRQIQAAVCRHRLSRWGWFGVRCA